MGQKKRKRQGSPARKVEAKGARVAEPPEAPGKRATAKPKRIAARVGRYALYGAAVVGIVALVWLAASSPRLPPTKMQGHTEELPAGHILKTPMPDVVQRHMLEHADGKGRPGVIIQYNCSKYSCEADLVAKLTDLVKQYPDNVYLAPNDYDAKIVLTKVGKSLVLDAFDEEAIRKFIRE